ncbi:MAG TPA: hypothetical protein VFV50_08370 [Bdellovibrionales bacterium]|nr:hypothetical protein [Bdellovibrionales bacterium]
MRSIAAALIFISTAAFAEEGPIVSFYKACMQGSRVTFEIDNSTGETLYRHLAVAETRGALGTKTGAHVACAQTPPPSEFWDGPNHLCKLDLTGGTPAQGPGEAAGVCETGMVGSEKSGADLVLKIRGVPAQKIMFNLNGGVEPPLRQVFIAGALSCRSYRVIIPNRFFRPRRYECLVKVDRAGRLLAW